MTSYSLNTDNGSLNINLSLKDPKIVNFDMQVNNVTSDSININISNLKIYLMNILLELHNLEKNT
jgi:hypothetical protein